MSPMQRAAPADENAPPAGAVAGKRVGKPATTKPTAGRRTLGELTNRGPPVRRTVATKSTSSRRRKPVRLPPKVEDVIPPLASDLPTPAPTASSTLPAGVRDIDAGDVAAGDHLSEGALARAVHANLRARERAFMADAGYMDQQTDITERMRAILVDWLVDVHAKFRLVPETLHLTVNIIDRFLAGTRVARRRLQLVGVTAMLIAAKYEEIYGPEVADFVYISDRAYTKAEILSMEATILNRLHFCVTAPSARVFLARTLKAASHALPPADAPAAGHLAAYCVELALQDAGMLRFAPSERAAAAVRIAGRAVGAHVPWCGHMRFHCGDIEPARLAACEDALLVLLEQERDPAGTNKLTGLKRKFADERYLNVSQRAGDLDRRVPPPCTPVTPTSPDARMLDD